MSTLVGSSGSNMQGGIKRTQLESFEFADGYVVNSSVVEVQAGVTADQHTHPGHEIGYVLWGKATIVVAGRPDEHLSSGGMYRIPANAVHFARVGDASNLRVVSVFVVDKNKPLATITNTPLAVEKSPDKYGVLASVETLLADENQHFHAGYETGYVIFGEGCLRIQGYDDQPLTPGSSYTVPADRPHAIGVVGGKPLNLFITHIVTEVGAKTPTKGDVRPHI